MFHLALFLLFVSVAMATLLRLWSASSARFHRWQELAAYFETAPSDASITWFEGWFDLRGGHSSNEIAVGYSEAGLHLQLTWLSCWANPAVAVPWRMTTVEGELLIVTSTASEDEPIAIRLTPDQLARLEAQRAKSNARAAADMSHSV